MGLPSPAPLAFPAPAEARAAATLAALEPADRALLCTLRRAARSAQIGATAGAAATLLAALDAGAARRLVFHPDRAATVAFGEAWLLSLIGAFRRGDRESAAFLIGRCVAGQHRQVIFRAAERLAAVVGTREGL